MTTFDQSSTYKRIGALFGGVSLYSSKYKDSVMTIPVDLLLCWQTVPPGGGDLQSLRCEYIEEADSISVSYKNICYKLTYECYNYGRSAL